MYDVSIIGAGMSGLAAGIRLAMFGQRVCILERHYAVGGLNSYYRLDGRNYDVGLHALTNFAPRGAKHGPLPRLLRQLRIGWDDFELAEQNGSSIAFSRRAAEDSTTIRALLAAEIERAFPKRARYVIKQLLGKLLELRQLQSAHAGDASAREILEVSRSANRCWSKCCCARCCFTASRARARYRLGIVQHAVPLDFSGRLVPAARRHSRHLEASDEAIQATWRRTSAPSRRARNRWSKTMAALNIVLDDGIELSAKQVISSAGWNETMRLCPSARQC